VQHRDEVTAVIEEWLQSLERDEAMKALYQARVVAAPVLTPDEAVTHRIYSDRETVIEVDFGPSQRLGVINAPYRSTGWRQKPALAPTQGGDTNAVLTEWLGLRPNDIHQLAQSGVFGGSQLVGDAE
jgi:2-methylfumaryl-CoA isomerase